ncbi:hypothetical protein SLS58_008763 [Diplodia intermedia]|uniref:Methylisocitrate lyase n=1 Tax=Diplodia intermedia TaxID=856260 RepID=A0ABR3TGK8_9PEZI
MTEPDRFARAARALEKVPCELHERVFAELELEHVIRIAQFAGPQVRWSIENSPSWSRYFRMTNRAELQELLALTDDIVALCYQPSTFKQSPLYRRLEFLHFKKTQIELTYSSFHNLHSAWADAVAQVFLQVVRDISNHGPAEHANYLSSTPAAEEATSLSEVHTQDADVLSRLFIVPTAALDASEDATFFNNEDADLTRASSPPTEASFDPIEEIAFFNDMCHTYKPVAPTTDEQQPAAANNNRPPSVADMTRWVSLYNKMRRARLARQAAELERMANLYERHPMHVREPWAPQTPRHNPRHVVIRLRAEAKLLRFKSDEHGGGRLPCHGEELARYRFTPAFAPVVPYDWCLRLFCAVLRRHPLPDGDGEGDDGGQDGVYPSEMVEKVKEARDGLTTFWDTFGEKMLDPTKIETLRTADTPWSEPPGTGDEGARFLTLRGRKERPFPHCELELCWLEAFTKVIAWMEDRFPSLVLEVRGEEWDKGDDVEAVMRQREDRKQRKLEATRAKASRLKQSLISQTYILLEFNMSPPSAEPLTSAFVASEKIGAPTVTELSADTTDFINHEHDSLSQHSNDTRNLINGLEPLTELQHTDVPSVNPTPTEQDDAEATQPPRPKLSSARPPSASTKLRKMLEETDDLIVAPGVYDGVSARAALEVGFNALYMTGAGTTASRLGQPDLGIAHLHDMRANAEMIANLSPYGPPLIADMDTGYGGPITIARTVSEYIRAGVAGAHLEDQILTKRCGHLAHKPVIPRAAYTTRLRAAASARAALGSDFVLIARTDALQTLGYDECVARLRAARALGFDVGLLEGRGARCATSRRGH